MSADHLAWYVSPGMLIVDRLSEYPGLAITLIILAANLLGDGLRDLLDPRLKGRGLGR